MKHENLDVATTMLSGILTAVQTDEVFRWISFIITLISAVLGIVYRIWHWYKEAKKDGKITADEIEDLGTIIKGGTDEITDIIKDKNKEDPKEDDKS